MNEQDNPSLADSDIVALAQRYLDRELSPPQQSALFERLRSDRSAQTQFVRCMMQTVYLDELLAQQRSSQPGSPAEGSGGDLAAGAEHAAESASQMPAMPTPLQSGAPDCLARDEAANFSAFSFSRAFPLPSPWSWLTGSGGLAVTASVVAVAALAWMFTRHRENSSVERQAVPLVAAAPDGFDPRTVRIDSGSARITLPRVGYMLIDGPAEVNLIGPLRAKLNRGRIRVRVTEPTGHGFVVETPDGDVADLSTEFGLDVSEGKKTGVVVFDGEVDLHLPMSGTKHAPRIQRLVGGEGVTFDKSGKLKRIISIVTGDVATFQSSNDSPEQSLGRVIAQVTDSVRSAELKNFYEIVPGGLNEDALAYADRPAHDWNGIDERGMPTYLVGADYVKTFNDDKMRHDVKLFVTLAQPARLFVLLDKRVSPPGWLRKDFKNTGDEIGLDAGAYTMEGVPITYVRATGPGKSLDAWFSIWEREVHQPGVVTLGPNLGASDNTGMYAIAATCLTQPAIAPSSNLRKTPVNFPVDRTSR